MYILCIYYVYIYVPRYICIYLRIFIYAYILTYIYLHIYSHIYIPIYIFLHIYIFLSIHIIVYSPLDVCLFQNCKHSLNTLCRPSDPKIQVYRSCFVGRLMMEMLDRQSNVVFVVVVVVGFIILAGQPNPPRNKAL